MDCMRKSDWLGWSIAQTEGRIRKPGYKKDHQNESPDTGDHESHRA